MAESNRDEIAKLESMYAANPEGRVFTHLAEAYRKAGDLVRAREVLEDGLGRHADSASGYVVLGRVMQDMGQEQEATAAFARVLELDPENRVALRALGELARAAGDTEQATAHFRQLLALDPSDESVETLLAELQSGAPAGAPAAVQPSPETSSFEVFNAAEATPSTPAAELGTLDIGTLIGPHEEEAPAPLDISFLGTVSPAEAPQDAAPEAPPALELPPLDGGWAGAVHEEAPLDTHMEVAASSAEAARGHADEEAPEDATPLPVLEGTEPTWPATAQGEPETAPAAEAPPEWESAEPTEVVTETMAELYRAQGHLDRAVEVYRALLRDRPGDEQLERKLLELELAILSPEAASAAAAPADAAAAETAPVEAAPAEGVPEAAIAPADGVAVEAVAEVPNVAPEAAQEVTPEVAQAEAPVEPEAGAAAEPEPWTAPVQEEPWSAPVEAESAVADATPHEELPEPWSESAVAAEPAASELAPEAPTDAVAFQPESVSFGEEVPAEPEALAQAEAATSSPEPALPAMEAVWASAGEMAEGEPSPYDFQAPEEEVGPPISAYLRGLVAWRRTTPAEPIYAPAVEEPAAYDTPAGFEPAFYEPPAQEPSDFQAPAGYESSGYEEQGFAAPSVEPPAGFESAEAEPWTASAPEHPAQDAVAHSESEALPQEWLDTPAAPPGSVDETPWSAPSAEPTWADEAAAEGEEPAAEAAAPAGDLDWLTGPNGVAPATPPPPPLAAADDSERGEGPTDDDDLEMFRAWLQSLKK